MYKTYEAKRNLFEEIDGHLTEDAAPSEFISKISGGLLFKSYPFNMLLRLKDTKQPLKHHPEGSVWNHTMMVLDEAASRKKSSKNERVFMWAALLHDIGKPDTTKIRKGRITSYGHDETGARLAFGFLSEFEPDEGFAEDVAALVRWHMQVLFIVKGLPWADIDSMRSKTDLRDVALLALCDRLGRKGASESCAREDIKIFLEKCKANNNLLKSK